MKRKILFGIFSFFILAFIIGSDVKVSQNVKNEESLYKYLEMYVDVMKIVKNQYVEPVDDKQLLYGSLKGMLMSLDPYSAFLEPEVKKELETETKGEFEGVGMEITLKDGLITVVSPIEDTPAWRAGIKPEDKIIEIDGKSTKGLTTWEAAKKLRGKKGTEVEISIMRKNVPKLIKIKLVRDVIIVKSVKTKEFDDIGYLKITAFQEKTGKDVSEKIIEFNKKNLKGLILDLRNNPGGLLSSAIEVSEVFLPQGSLILYTQGRDQKDRKNFYTKNKALWEKPIVVLCNQGSASASEIVIGALKDNLKYFSSVGEKTFGKGSVQNLIGLQDGSALKLTIAHYYTPKGECIEEKGIMPKIQISLPEEEEIILGEEKDIQLKKAIEEIKRLIIESEKGSVNS